ncbi:MAG: addiction module protein [Kiritimatiellae bacterium]|nr:addiction module protein [Kiritimatiellia bacterium]
MSMTAEKLVEEALGLPCAVRAFVAEQLIESLDTDASETLSPEWKREVEKRCREIDQGTANLIPADDVFNKAYARLS